MAPQLIIEKKESSKKASKADNVIKFKTALFQLTILLVVTLIVLLIVGGGVGFLIKSDLEEEEVEVAAGKA